MKGIILDENLPRNVTFSPSIPLTHVSDLGPSISDSALWRHAREQELVIVSKDADFTHRMMLAPPPPWVVHLRFGNLRRREFHTLLAKMWPSIESLLPGHKLINVYADRVEAVSA